MYVYIYIHIYICVYIYIFKTRAVVFLKRSSTSTNNLWKIVDPIPLENIMLHKFNMSKECSMLFKEVQYCFF